MLSKEWFSSIRTKTLVSFGAIFSSFILSPSLAIIKKQSFNAGDRQRHSEQRTASNLAE
jgi:hypothetical protein